MKYFSSHALLVTNLMIILYQEGNSKGTWVFGLIFQELRQLNLTT